MQTLWRLLLTGGLSRHRVTSTSTLEGSTEARRTDSFAATRTARIAFAQSDFEKAISRGPEDEATEEPTRIRQLVDWELVLTADHVHSSIRDLSDESWRAVLPVLLDDLQQLLRDAMDLLRELGEQKTIAIAHIGYAFD